MKLLFITQIVDGRDDNLGFIHGWLAELAKHVETLEVIALYEGVHDLPKNVHVHSLGKEHGVSRLTYILRLISLVMVRQSTYDRVFVHMNAEYLVLFGWWWRLTGKKTALWWTHKNVDLKQRIATFFVNVALTASSESFRLPTPKLNIIGHGIGVNWLDISRKRNPEKFRILSIARISPTKGYDLLIDALKGLTGNYEMLIVGGPLTEGDALYQQTIEQRLKNEGLEGRVFLVGSVPHPDILPYLEGADLFVNLSNTGSLDKAVLEAMAARIPVLTSNQGLQSTLRDVPESLLPISSVGALAERIQEVILMPEEKRKKWGEKLRTIVVNDHSLSGFMEKVVALLQ